MATRIFDCSKAIRILAAAVRGWLGAVRLQGKQPRAADQALAAERRRIARELHDEMGALLTAARLELAALQRAAARADANLEPHIARVKHVMDRCQAAKRQIVDGLCTNAGLARSLHQRLLALQADFEPHLHVELDLHDGPPTRQPALHPALVHAVFRVAQEALTNAVTHGQATKVALRTRCSDTLFTIEVCDNGCGLALPPTHHNGKGLAGMRARVQELQGRLDLRSVPGGGACVVASLPLRPAWHGGAEHGAHQR